MFMNDIRAFLESNGWQELAVMHSKHGDKPGSVFHHFSDGK
jgi:hypothetical protein